MKYNILGLRFFLTGSPKESWFPFNQLTLWVYLILQLDTYWINLLSTYWLYIQHFLLL